MSPMASKRQFILLLCAWNTECVSAMVDCDDVQYSNDKIDEDEYIDNCIPEQWRGFFRNMDQVKLGKLASDLVHESKALNNSIEPKMPLLFNALKLVKGPQDVKVVIVGQDPTPQKGKATGLAFSVENPRRVPAVLNVLLEVAFEGFAVDLDNGDLSSWAHQGVLLLNAALTVPQTGAAKGKHRNMWKDFTSYLVKHISENAHPSVWLLWGRDAKAFRSEIEKVKMYGKPKHLVIEGGHPSPVSFAMSGDSFFGGGYFLCANRFLRVNERDEINWSLTHYRWKSLKRCPPVEKSETEIRQNFKNRYKHKIQQIEYLKNYHKQEQNRLTQERQTLMSQKGIMPPQQCKGSVEVTLQNYDLHENQLKLLEKQENQIKQQEEEELKKAHEQGPHILLQVKQIEPFELQLLQQWSHLREQQQQQQQQHQQHQQQQQQQLQQQQQHQQHQQQQHQLL